MFFEQSNASRSVKDHLLSTPSVVPISIRSYKMKREGDVSCTTNNCPDIKENIDNYDPNSESQYNCGETCTATTGSFEYTFRGEKFGIYGVYSTSNGKFNVFLDEQKVTEIDSNRASNDKYSLLYISNDLSYGNHTVKIQGQGNKRFQIYKLVFWPSLKAKRMNISDFNNSGTWVYESDQIGGIRGYTVQNGPDETAIAPVRFSKLWLYGTVCQWHHPFNLNINTYQVSINPNNPELDNNDKRLDAELLYEEDFQPSENLKFTMVQVATLNCIYYIEEPAPSPTPSVLPISIRSAKMKKDGDAKCDETNNCPRFEAVENYHPDADDTYECGEICTVKSGSLEYTFKGEKFGIYGVYAPNNGKVNVLLDGRNVAEIDSGKTKTINHHSVFYISNDLSYGDHTVKIQAQGNKDAQIYKLVFWPSLKAKRMNITELTRTGTWKYESDLIGGLRAYTQTDGTDETASASIRFSKLWVYGTICQWHGRFQLDIYSFNHEINSHDPTLTDDNLRLDSALLYETPELAPSDGFKFTMTQTSTLNYVYYIEESAIHVPSVVPISIRSAKMKRTGQVSCGSNDCPGINNNVNNYNPDAENTYQCGETCSVTDGSFEYSFIGEKFGIYSAYSLTNGKYDILLDGQKVKEIDLGKQGTSKYSLSYISDDLQYREHTVKIQGKNNKQIQLYKLVFWPSLQAKRFNVTQFQRTGKWKYETDLIGGVRAYTEVDDPTNDVASTNLRFSKLWIYGTRCNWHGKFNAYFGNLEAEINEHDSSLNNDDIREDSALVFESPIVDSKQYNLRIEMKESITINYVYYIEERMPMPTPSATPISIRFAKMTLSGDSSCGTNNCPDLNRDLENYHPEDENTYQCGETCTATTGLFEYSFTGVKFGIFGSYSSNNGAFDVLVDGQKVNDVDTSLESNEKFSLLYLSENLSYHKHTVKIQAKGNKQIQLYKLVFWPSLNAK